MTTKSAIARALPIVPLLGSTLLFSSTVVAGLPSGPDIELGCNEEWSEGKHCGVEVKCYQEYIYGEFELYFEYPYFESFHYFDWQNGTFFPLCAGYNGGDLHLKHEYKCTENQNGRDAEGDTAAEVIIDFTGCVNGN